MVTFAFDLGISGQAQLIGLPIPNVSEAFEVEYNLKRTYFGLGLNPAVSISLNNTFDLKYSPVFRYGYYRRDGRLGPIERRFFDDHHFSVSRIYGEGHSIGLGLSWFSRGKSIDNFVIRTFDDGTTQIDDFLELDFTGWHITWQRRLSGGRLKLDYRLILIPRGNISFLGYDNGSIIAFLGVRYQLFSDKQE